MSVSTPYLLTPCYKPIGIWLAFISLVLQLPSTKEIAVLILCGEAVSHLWLGIVYTQVPVWIKGARDGAVVRALASHQCGPGSNPSADAICGLSLLFVFSFAPRGFPPGTPVFPSSQKPTFPNSNSTRNQVDEEPLCGCVTSNSLFIYLFY